MKVMIPAWVGDTLEPVEKLEVHQRGLRHKAISVFIMAGRDVLLQQRALGKYHTPGLWTNSCCTHPHWDEAPLTCALRRMEEEMGITGIDLSYRGRVEYRATVGNGLIEHEVVDIYVGEASHDLDFTLNPDEVKDAIWMDIDALQREAMRRPERFTPWLHIYLENHRDKIFGRDDS
ncbi:MAG: isopentenyl-diphosphate Delta-isomerase [Loktanella sp.]|nr:isopentenyl-diphosphate Delta-isomerase [Loktanella sp.]